MNHCLGIGGVVLAAGASRRMGGRHKALLPCEGERLVHRVARVALAAGLRPVWVVVGAEAAAVQQAVDDLPVVVLHNPAWQAGQSTSVQLAGRVLSAAPLAAAVILPADQPFVPPSLIQALCETYRRNLAPIIMPAIADQRSTPVLLGPAVFPLLANLTGDRGARALFDRIPPLTLPWSDRRALADIDTPADYRRWCPEGATWQAD